MDSEEINNLLDFVRHKLNDNGAGLVLKDKQDKNCLRITNKVLSFGPNWTLMAGVDSGFFRISSPIKRQTKLTYSFTVVTGWIMYLIFLTAFFLLVERTEVLFLSFYVGILAWFIGLLRHLFFFITITNEIKELVIRGEK